MKKESLHTCQCSICLGPDANPTREVHRAMNYLFGQLDKRQQALYIGLEAKKRGAESERALSLILGWSEEAIAVARRELERQTGESPEQAAAQGCPDEEEAACFHAAKLARAQAYQPKISRGPNFGYHK